MNPLVQIFEKLDYTQVLDIADEFYFYPDSELKKSDYDRQFAKFLKKEGFIDEVMSRYESKPGLEKDTPEQAISLFSFQSTHKGAMIEGFDRHITFINASETGTGKTYVTLSFAETEKRPLIVICPKSVLPTWYLLAIQNEVEILCICNYETFILGKMYVFSGNVNMDKLPRVDNPYLKRVEIETKSAKKRIDFEWKNLPERTMIVFDEAHYCKNIAAQRTRLLLSAYDYAKHPENRWKKIGIALLSATIIEKKQNLMPFMYVLGYATSPKAKNIIDAEDFSVRDFGYRLISERRMTRSSMREAREALKDYHTTDVRTKMFKLNDADREKIQAACKEIRNVLSASEGKKPKNHLAIILQKRQEIEALKVGILFNELQSLRSAGYSVAIFVNFRESHAALISMIKKDLSNEKYSVIIGGQEAGVRLREIDKFQNGDVDIIICMVTAGGIGISLHDTKGGRPRYGLISPPESATQTVQAIGRLDRIGAKTDSIQRIIFIADTIEEKIAENLNRKMQTIGELNGDEDEADNLFLYDIIHDYNGTKHEIHNGSQDGSQDSSTNGAGEVLLEVDNGSKTIIVSIPPYMCNAFENGIPQEALGSMKIRGDKYHFDITHKGIIVEFLQNLTN